MQNHIEDSKLLQIKYNKFKFPLIQFKTKAEVCNKNLNNFKKCASEEKPYLDLKKFKIKDSQLLRKLKIVSLIKNDHQSLRTIPISEGYAPYKRTLQAQINKYSKPQQKKSVKDKQHKRARTHQKNGFSVQKVNFSSQLEKQKANQRGQSVLYCMKKSLKQQIFEHQNILSLRKFLTNSERVYTCESCTINSKQSPTNIEVDYLNEQEIQQRQQREESVSQKLDFKLRPLPKVKFELKKNLCRDIFNQNNILNSSIRGWTKYKNFTDYPEMEEINK